MIHSPPDGLKDQSCTGAAIRRRFVYARKPSTSTGGCHGQGSDAKQQGKEEAEGRLEQEEEGRHPSPVAVGTKSGQGRTVRKERLRAGQSADRGNREPHLAQPVLAHERGDGGHRSRRSRLSASNVHLTG